jgi:hypothetical protein
VNYAAAEDGAARSTRENKVKWQQLFHKKVLLKTNYQIYGVHTTIVQQPQPFDKKISPNNKLIALNQYSKYYRKTKFSIIQIHG